MIARREPDARGRDRGLRNLGNDAPALRAPISVSEAPSRVFARTGSFPTAGYPLPKHTAAIMDDSTLQMRTTNEQLPNRA